MTTVMVFFSSKLEILFCFLSLHRKHYSSSTFHPGVRIRGRTFPVDQEINHSSTPERLKLVFSYFKLEKIKTALNPLLQIVHLLAHEVLPAGARCCHLPLCVPFPVGALPWRQRYNLKRHQHVSHSAPTVSKHRTNRHCHHRTFSLTKSLIDHGNLKRNPSTILKPYSQTTFELTSPIWNDRIEYTWGYTPTSPWCGDVPSEVDGTYKFTFGVNTCDLGSVFCSGVGNMTLLSEDCDKPIGTSSPTFYMLIYYDS